MIRSPLSFQSSSDSRSRDFTANREVAFEDGKVRLSSSDEDKGALAKGGNRSGVVQAECGVVVELIAGFKKLKKGYNGIRKVGDGGYAAIYRAEDADGRAVAIKRLPLTEDGISAQRVVSEISLMSALVHPGIVPLLRVYQSPNSVYLVMPYFPGGDLHEFLRRRGPLSEAQTRRLMLEIVTTVKFLHDNKIVHRDLKAENLFLTSSNPDAMHVVLGDLGLSTMYALDHMRNTYVGTMAYSSPELLRHEDYVGPELDMWALGVLLYVMAVGQLPFYHREANLMQWMIAHRQYHRPARVSETFMDLFLGLCSLNPARRLAVDEVLRHPWLDQEGFDADFVVSKMKKPAFYPLKTKFNVSTDDSSDPNSDSDSDSESGSGSESESESESEDHSSSTGSRSTSYESSEPSDSSPLSAAVPTAPGTFSSSFGAKLFLGATDEKNPTMAFFDERERSSSPPPSSSASSSSTGDLNGRGGGASGSATHFGGRAIPRRGGGGGSFDSSRAADVRHWNVQTVLAWLATVGLSALQYYFVVHEIDGQKLMRLTEEDCNKLGVSDEQAKKLWDQVSKFKSSVMK